MKFISLFFLQFHKKICILVPVIMYQGGTSGSNNERQDRWVDEVNSYRNIRRVLLRFM